MTAIAVPVTELGKCGVEHLLCLIEGASIPAEITLPAILYKTPLHLRLKRVIVIFGVLIQRIDLSPIPVGLRRDALGGEAALDAPR